MNAVLTHKSILILETIASQLSIVTSVLTPNTPEYTQLLNWLESRTDLQDHPILYRSEIHIRYIQTLMLVALSLYGGIFLSQVHHFEVHDADVEMIWDSGIKDTFTLGQWDDNCAKWCHAFQSRLMGPLDRSLVPTASLSVLIPMSVLYYAKAYRSLIASIQSQLESLLQSPSNILRMIQSPQNSTLLFILISCLPESHINTLFLQLSQSLPNDLTTKTPSGNTINASRFLGSPTANFTYLFEKISVFMSLFFDQNLPHVSKMTHAVTISALTQPIQNPTSFSQIQSNLNQLLNGQVRVRLTLYDLVQTHLNSVIQAIPET